jgi:beta-lactam-binding protein with PASTA domain
MSEKRFLDQLNEKENKPESFEPEHFERVKKSRLKYFFYGLLLISSIIGALYMFNRPTVMVDMIGLNENDALLWANKNDVQLVFMKDYSETAATGTVISQSIMPQTALHKSDIVELTVSLGIDPDKLITLPSFDSQWSKSDIVGWIEDNHITNYQFVSAEDETAVEDSLIGFSTENGSLDSIKRSDQIVFTIASQPEIIMITMDNLVSMSQTQAENWALTNGIKSVIKTAYSNSVDKGKVISQDISAGSAIESGSTVVLVISNGPAIKIADFQTLSVSEAKQWATQNNIQLSIETKYHMSIPSGKLISQSVIAGTWVSTGTKIQMVYSLGNKLSIADFVNQPISELESFVASQNELGAKLKLSVIYQYSNVTSINRIVYIGHRDTKIGIDTEIDVIVSLGRLVKMPDLSLLKSTDAEILALEVIETCEVNGLTCKILYVTTEEAESANTVVYQSVEPNVYISNSVLVEVHIAKLAD